MIKKLSQCFVIAFTLLSIISCNSIQKAHLKEIKPFVGIWKMVDQPQNIIIFKIDGSFYNLTKDKGINIVTHSGVYKILTNNTYILDINYARTDAIYQLAGKQYVNHFQFSDNNLKMKISGVVDAKNGGARLEWSDQLEKVSSIE